MNEQTAEQQANEIALQNSGKVALVDAHHVATASQFGWRISQTGHAASGTWRLGNFIYLHHLVLPKKPGMCVDHINRNKLDNRRSNLRYATKSQNAVNAKKNSNNKSGYRGVSFYKSTGQWVAQLRCAGRKRKRGYFPSKIAAAKAYDQWAVKAFGKFAALNFPGKA